MPSSPFPRTPALAVGDAESKREEIRQYFLSTFLRTEQLFETLAGEEAYLRKPISLRHPLIFYLGHTATFFVNKMILAGWLSERIHPGFESMFAVGVDEMSWDDLDEKNYQWPSVAEVMAYRDEVRELTDRLIRTTPLALPIDPTNPWWVILMCVEHERIHLETSSVLIRQHDLRYVRPHPAWQPCRKTGEPPRNELVAVPGASVCLGKQTTADSYGWDNEYGVHQAEIASFEAARYLVSNREFLDFVDDGGYRSDACWEEEGLAWRNYARAAHPTFWSRRGDRWLLRLMTEEVEMPWDWPVEVNYHEAKAFCNWKKARTGKAVRLPTEDEWYRLRDFGGVGDVPCDGPAGANLHLDHYASSCPVDEFRHGDLYDVAGNVWQWTETPIYPFDGFEVHPLYDDFSTPTFDGRHNLIKGGSWASCGNVALTESRYAFRRHFFQHAGFRYVVAETPAAVHVSHYETDELLTQYDEFHYGDEFFGVPNFPRALAAIAIEAMGSRPARRALDLGCATGRATFELARHFDRVTGVDFSARLIGAGVQMAEHGVLRYRLTEEGKLTSDRERRLADLGLDAVRDKVDFVQGDACNLKASLRGYDLILAANLIDRLYSPRRFLAGVHERLEPGGLLVLASPYTWLEEHTAVEEWIGGVETEAGRRTTLDGLREILAAHFRLLQPPRDVPLVIRETARKFQHTISEVTIWERRP